MKLAVQRQTGPVTDPTLARYAMVRPVLTALLHSLKRARIERLGGVDKVTLEDLAREYRQGSGDSGICFEYAVHDALLTKHPHVHSRVSEVLEKFCRIKEGAESILFGVEKGATLKLVATGAERLTDESRILVGGAGQPPKLKKHMATIYGAFHSPKLRAILPRSIRGLWRTDLFVGSTGPDRWVATTLKTNADQLEADAGIRLGISPERRAGELPAWDERRNLILCPLQYNGAFVELFYASFAIVKQVLLEDARVPPPWVLHASDDRFIAKELVDRREYPIGAILDAFARLAQPELLAESFTGDSEDETTEAVAPVPRID
jgi:hypothetical protein